MLVLLRPHSTGNSHGFNCRAGSVTARFRLNGMCVGPFGLKLRSGKITSARNTMPRSRRAFLMTSGAALLSPAARPQPAEPPPGTPQPFGAAPAVGPEVNAETFVAAEKLLGVELTAAERTQAAVNWRSSMATVREHRSGPRKVPLVPTLAPY